MQGTQVQSLGQEDPPGEGNGNLLQHSCLEDLMDREACGLQSTGSQRVTHNLVTKPSPPPKLQHSRLCGMDGRIEM